MSVIHESAENYLESILMLSKKLPVVRSIDVANELGFKKSSVSIAMKTDKLLSPYFTKYFDKFYD